MSGPRKSRETLLPLLANHVLEHGLAGASLRPLARAAGTSDRMLIYHFGSKEGLVSALLLHLSDIYATTLDTAFPQGRAASRRDCAATVLAVTAQAEFQPFMRIWWDIVAGCSAGDGDFLAAAGAMIDRLLLWVEEHLPAQDPDPRQGAREVMAVIEGAMMLRAVGRAAIGEAGLGALES